MFTPKGQGGTPAVTCYTKICSGYKFPKSNVSAKFFNCWPVYFLMEKFPADYHLPFVSSARGVQYPNIALGSLTCLRSSVDPFRVFTSFFVYAVNPSNPKTGNKDERDKEICVQLCI